MTPFIFGGANRRLAAAFSVVYQSKQEWNDSVIYENTLYPAFPNLFFMMSASL